LYEVNIFGNDSKGKGKIDPLPNQAPVRKDATQNQICNEIKNGLASGNVCYHSVQNFFSSCALSIRVMITL
jgi:hypothetical protein